MSTTASRLSIRTNSAAEICGIQLRCPRCGGRFEVADQGKAEDATRLRCSGCFFGLHAENRIWKALPADRESYFCRFMTDYQAVRSAEGRGSETSEYYLALPEHDVSGSNQSQWTIRARTFQYFRDKLLPLMETSHPAEMKILDLGAGNGWMSYRLALRGHKPIAVDLLTNNQDGLGAAEHFRAHLPSLFPRFQAELDRLPFADNQFDLAIFNASLHYSEDYTQTLQEAIRCVCSRGNVVIADTAWYRREESGEQMLAERRQAFLSKYGFASDDIKSLEFLTDERLHALESRLGVKWQVHLPSYGPRWAVRPLVAKLRGRREPSRFRIYVAEVRK